ncbi:MAG: hypothetical protein EBS90_12920 [Betaproteobacteria bacterium]|nr:hypothetical protein [Betaproteobacteria bacterium]
MLRECVECGVGFNPLSPAKKRAGGLIGTCPDCSDERAVKYLGTSAGDGKMASISILAFDSAGDRDKYADFFRNNSGLHKGKSCQLGSHLSTDPGVRFRTVTQSGPMNHKGRL